MQIHHGERLVLILTAEMKKRQRNRASSRPETGNYSIAVFLKIRPSHVQHRAPHLSTVSR